MSKLRDSFEESAEDYLRSRSEYPNEMIDDIIETAQLSPTSRVLDIGCGSGQATMEFVSRGYQVVAIDLAMSALNYLAERCTDSANVKFVHSTLEDFQTDCVFDLIISAQAFHWLDPNLASVRIKELLQSSGHVMLFWHMQDVIPTSPQAILYQLGSMHFGSFPLMNPPEYSREFLDSMALILCKDDKIGDLQVSEYPWVQIYDKSMFVSLFHSWSKYVMLPDSTKVRVDAEFEDYLDSLNGDPAIRYRTCLIHARKLAS
jgi:SAM-dependent methyltransferase